MSIIKEQSSDLRNEKSVVKALRRSVLEAEYCTSVKNEIPEEGWLAIFEKLDAKDQLTFLRTCTEWKKLISHKRTILLLPQLSHLILDRLRCTSDVLNLRMVCKSWKNAVDRFNAPYGTILRCEEFLLEEEDDTYLGLQVIFSYNEEIQAFMKDMKSNIENPFPGRIVGFCPLYGPTNTVEDDERNSILSREFWNNANVLLEKFGSHLNVAGFIMRDIDYYSHGKNAFEGLIRKIVRSLENLKHMQMVIDVDMEQIPFFEDGSLCKLFAVETLDLKLCNPELLSVMLESCCIPANIKRLQFIHDKLSRIPDVVYQFQNLKVLRVAINCDSDLERFQSLQQPLPLQEIQLIFERNKPEVELIFTCLEKFKTTLVYAGLMFFGISTPEYTARQKKTICNGLKLNLPNLKKLKLYGYNGPLDPFLQLNSLVHFEVHVSGNLWKYEGSEVDCLGVENQMYKSKIWDVIPSLKRFVYAAAINQYSAPVYPILYNRKGLEEYRSNNVDG